MSASIKTASLAWLGLAMLCHLGCGRRKTQVAETPQVSGPVQPADTTAAEPAAGRLPTPTQPDGSRGGPQTDIDAQLAETERQVAQALAQRQQADRGGPAPKAPETGEEPAPPQTEPDRPHGTVVIGRVVLASNVPDPSTVPYRDCVTFVKYKVERVESGEYADGELLAVFWGMRDAKLQPAASFSQGQRHRLKIEPFAERSELARVMQADDTNEFSLTPYWVTDFSEA